MALVALRVSAAVKPGGRDHNKINNLLNLDQQICFIFNPVFILISQKRKIGKKLATNLIFKNWFSFKREKERESERPEVSVSRAALTTIKYTLQEV